MSENKDKMQKVVSLAKRRGFVFPGSDIYGGLANSWDYGPLGVELKRNIHDWWWDKFVRSRSDMYGLDAAMLMNPEVWESSGHVDSFNDVMIECKSCNKRHRADHLVEEAYPEMKVDGKTPEELTDIIKDKKISCPNCGKKNFANAQTFNQLFETHTGITEDDRSIYLRGEIAQAMFVDFKNVLDTMHPKLPFGIASTGRVFRKEITPGNFIYRTLEFDLMEFEYFIRESEWKDQFEYWLSKQKEWLEDMGFDLENTRVREHTQEELAHYSKKTVDLEYNTPFGWKEVFGLAYRTDFDLKNHMEQSGVDLRYTDPETKEKFTPHVIEPTFGLTRMVLITLLEGYQEDTSGKKTRIYLKLHPRLAPYKAAVFPLLANKEELVEKAREIFEDLQPHFPVAWDDRGNIGKRYLSQDEIGTPYCITVDFDSLEDDAVTIRDRDTTEQERIAIGELKGWIEDRV